MKGELKEAVERKTVIADALMSILFGLTQPKHGDIFGWIDDRRDQIAAHIDAALQPEGPPAMGVEVQYDIVGAYMSDPTCFKEMDGRMQMALLRDLAANQGYDLVSARGEEGVG